jgi:sulfur carrier protein
VERLGLWIRRAQSRGTGQMSKIVIFTNGKAHQIEPQKTLSALVKDFKLKPNAILLERNGEAVLRSQWDSTPLSHGDRIELIRVVAGG